MKQFENKTVLVTGASGFIGKHLVERLSKVNGIRLLLLSRKLQTSNLPNVQWLHGSLSDLTKAYWKQQDVSCIQIVFHIGAFIPKVSTNSNNIEQNFSSNITGTYDLLEGLPGGVEHIVFSSTVDVYAPIKDDEVLSEASRIEPSGFYGASKLFCESLVSVWASQNNCKSAILRYGHIFGPGEGAYSKLIPLAIQQLLVGNPPNVYGSGRAERDFLYVSDAVEATIRSAIIDDNIEPVNIVRGESYPIKKIVELLVEKSGIELEINYLSDKPDGYSLFFDSSKMCSELGNWPLVSLEDGLAEEVSDFRRLACEQ